MVTELTCTAASPIAGDPQRILNRLKNCQRLPSLSSVNSALRELLNAEQRYSSHIAEVIRRDPSLTARLLRLVNSVYYGLTNPINGIEEAVFYLGVRQIRQLAMVTPIVEDFQRMVGDTPFPWREFWQHCIATAILTREVIGSFQSVSDESDYVAGLTHDVGKIVMASAFPNEFAEAHRQHRESKRELRLVEREILGVDHAELGAMYLQQHNLPEVLIQTARYHHEPERASHHSQIVAAVQIADMLSRQAGIGVSGNLEVLQEDQWMTVPGWDILFSRQAEAERNIACAGLKRSLERLPTILEGLV